MSKSESTGSGPNGTVDLDAKQAAYISTIATVDVFSWFDDLWRIVRSLGKITDCMCILTQ